MADLLNTLCCHFKPSLKLGVDVFYRDVTCMAYVWIDTKSRDVPNKASEAVRPLQQTALMLRSF